MFYKVVSGSEYLDKIYIEFTDSYAIHMKAFDQYFVVSICLFYKVVLISASVDEILKCDHSNESY